MVSKLSLKSHSSLSSTRRIKMKLSAPKMITWWIAVILGLLSIVGRFVPAVPLAGSHYLWFMFAGWLLFAVSTVVDML